MKTKDKIILIIILIVSLLGTWATNAQIKQLPTTIKFDLVIENGSKQVMTVKPDGTMVINDSLESIKVLYRELIKSKEERDFLSKQIFELSINEQKKNKK